MKEGLHIQIDGGFNIMKSYYIGIDIGGTNVRIGAVDENKNIIASERKRTWEVFSDEKTEDSLIGLIKSFMYRYNLQDDVEAISIGFPATLNKERTKVLQAPNINMSDNLNVVEILSKAFNIQVFIEKDVCTALQYDLDKYKIPEVGIIIGFYIGTGIGNIIYIDGKEITGKDGVACELGHIPVIGNLESCGCGNEGCIENIAGGKYLAKLCQTDFTETFIGDLFVKHKENIAIKNYIDNLAVSIATEINILNPDYILLGGGVLAMTEFPLHELEIAIRKHTRKPYPEQSLTLIYVEDDENKGVIGAALYAMKRIKEEIYDSISK